MAEAKKNPAKRSSTVAKATAKKPAQKVTKAKRSIKLPRFVAVLLKPFSGIGRYVKGAWVELRQVRWPNRKATWSLTGAVIVFSIFFAAVILGLDFAFQYLFKEILL